MEEGAILVGRTKEHAIHCCFVAGPVREDQMFERFQYDVQQLIQWFKYTPATTDDNSTSRHLPVVPRMHVRRRMRRQQNIVVSHARAFFRG